MVLLEGKKKTIIKENKNEFNDGKKKLAKNKRKEKS